MQAMLLQCPGAAEENILTFTLKPPVPTPAPGQVRVQVHTCAVCHTDLHTVEGELPLSHLPLIPGHQVVGTVHALGDAATRWRIGDRVGIGWMNQVCGQCAYCRRGEENLCPQARFTGLHVDGGYAQFVVAHERFVYALPDALDDVAAAPLLCGGIIGYRALRLSQIEPGGQLGLYGFGSSAHQAIQVARYWGCEVYVFTRSAAHREHAQALGARWVGSAEETPPVLLDASVTFAPAGWLVAQALAHLRPGGTLAINAIHMSPIPELPYALLYGERTVRSVTNFTAQDAAAYLRLAAEIPVRTEVEVWPLAEANIALRRLKHSEVRGAAVLRVRG
jgi:propanol-preferring alcohol dehydrogenase